MKKEELIYKEKLVELGCMVCRKLYDITDSPVELHHYRGGGWGKGNYLTLIPLCPEHHRGKSGIHGLGTKGFDKNYSFTQAELLAETISLLNNY